MGATNSVISSTKLNVRPLSGAIGAEITGVDLSKPLTDEQFAEIHQAFLDHLVIFFRDQDLGPEEMIGPIQEKWRRPTPFALLLPRI